MTMSSLSKFARSVQKTVGKYTPEILTGIGIAGMVMTTVLAVKATPKALELIENKKKELSSETNKPESLPAVEVVKSCWKCYIPAAITCGTSIGCLLGARSVSARRHTALATAYKLSESALSEYKDKVIETIGETKEKEIREAVAQDKIDSTPTSNTRTIIVNGKGDTLFLDAYTKRYFYSDVDTLNKVANIIDRRLMDEMQVSLNEFYYELDLEGTTLGDNFGWDIDRGFIELDLTPGVTENDELCWVVDFRNRPDYFHHR